MPVFVGHPHRTVLGYCRGIRIGIPNTASTRLVSIPYAVSLGTEQGESGQEAGFRATSDIYVHIFYVPSYMWTKNAGEKESYSVDCVSCLHTLVRDEERGDGIGLELYLHKSGAKQQRICIITCQCQFRRNRPSVSSSASSSCSCTASRTAHTTTAGTTTRSVFIDISRTALYHYHHCLPPLLPLPPPTYSYYTHSDSIVAAAAAASSSRLHSPLSAVRICCKFPTRSRHFLFSYLISTFCTGTHTLCRTFVIRSLPLSIHLSVYLSLYLQS